MQGELKHSISLVVDTNLFLECRPLPQIPWDELGAEKVELLVTRPVQTELDRHKKDARGRTFKKALAAAQLLRELATSVDDHLIIQEGNPRVILSVMKASRIKPELAPSLDPEFNDDAIILRLLEYREDHPTEDVRLLTHDTGPMTTAKSLGISFNAIPNAWLLSEQDDPNAKSIKKLQDELQRLRDQEPSLIFKVLDASGEEIKRLDLEFDCYEELTASQISELVDELKSYCAPVDDYGSAETVPQPKTFGLGYRVTVTEFKPASEQEIEKYRSESYPKWVHACHDLFSTLHTRLKSRTPWPEITFEIQNVGTRPAERCLVAFNALGSIVIMPPDSEDGDAGGGAKSKIANMIALPNPPTSPRGEWLRKTTSLTASQRIAAMTTGAFADPFAALTRQSSHLANIDLMRMPEPRDPDAFYWKDGRPNAPDVSCQLTCENWRHGIDPEEFDLRVLAVSAVSSSGAIKCEIHASNLSDPAQIMLPITVKWIQKSTYDYSRALLGDFKERNAL